MMRLCTEQMAKVTYTNFLKKVPVCGKSDILIHHERAQLIQPCLFNHFNNNKIHFLFCNNTSKPPVPFMYSHFVPVIIFSQKMLKTKQLRNISYHHIQPAI